MSNAEVLNSVTNSKATASLVIGAISIALTLVPIVGLILGVIGLFLGIIGLKEIKHLKQKGKNLAVSGIVCSCLGILFPIVLAIVGYIAYMGVTSTIS